MKIYKVNETKYPNLILDDKIKNRIQSLWENYKLRLQIYASTFSFNNIKVVYSLAQF